MFSKKSKKIIKYIWIVLSILIAISMVVAYMPLY